MIRRSENELMLEDESIIPYQKCMIKGREWCLPFSEEAGFIRFGPGQGISLEEWAKKEPSIEELMRMILAARELSLETGKYLLDDDHFYLDPGWIFWEKEGALLQAVYLPVRLDRGDHLQQWLPDFFWQAAAENDWSGKETMEFLFRYKKLSLMNEVPLLTETAEFEKEKSAGNMMLPALYHPDKKKRRWRLKLVLNQREGIFH